MSELRVRRGVMNELSQYRGVALALASGVCAVASVPVAFFVNVPMGMLLIGLSVYFIYIAD